MNKQTLVLLAAAVVLGAAAWLLTAPPAAPEVRSLRLAGYATPEQIEAEAGLGMLDERPVIPYPVDEIVVTRQGETLRFVRKGEGKTLSWHMVEPRESLAVKWSIEKMVGLFKTDTVSVYAKKVKPADLALFDLEPERRITVTLKQGGKVWNGVDLVIGKVDQSETAAAEDGVAKDTWVLAGGDEGTVYRIAGKDLREPFEQPAGDLRDRKVFGDLAAADLTRVTVTSPEGEVVVLEGERKEPPSGTVADGGAAAPPAKVEMTWTLVSPVEVKVDGAAAGQMVSALASLRTREFVPEAKAPADALKGPLWKVEGTRREGAPIVLEMAAAETDEVWAQVPGAGELLKLDVNTANGLRKGVAELRDRRLTDLGAEAITGVRFSTAEGAALRVERQGAGWRFAEPPVAFAADLDSVLPQLVDAKGTRHARTSELAAAQAATSTAAIVAELRAGERGVTLAFGAKAEDGGDRWAAVGPLGGAPTAYLLVPDFVATRFQKGVDDLRRKVVFDFDATAIQRLAVTWPGGETRVVLERPAAGGDLALTGVPEGRQPRAAAVTSLGSTLPHLRAKRFGDDQAAAALGLTAAEAYVLTATLADGSEHRLLISRDHKDASDPWATAETGPLAGQRFTLNNYQVMNLLKEPADLLE